MGAFADCKNELLEEVSDAIVKRIKQIIHRRDKDGDSSLVISFDEIAGFCDEKVQEKVVEKLNVGLHVVSLFSIEKRICIEWPWGST